MDFLVEIEIIWPPSNDPAEKAHLVAAESVRARELAEDGVLLRLWRIPGRWANVGLWRAADATTLHDALGSLPLYPWMNITVRPLADHPSDPGGR